MLLNIAIFNFDACVKTLFFFAADAAVARSQGFLTPGNKAYKTIRRRRCRGNYRLRTYGARIIVITCPGGEPPGYVPEPALRVKAFNKRPFWNETNFTQIDSV